MNIATVLSNENFNEHCHDYSKNGTGFEESLKAIVGAGFKNIFIQWYDNDKIWRTPQKEQLQRMRESGLNIIFAHLGYQNINTLWEDGIQGDNEVERYKQDIKDCKENEIDLVIMHLAKKYDKRPNEIGLNRIRQIVKFAKGLGVKIAFENVDDERYVEYVLDNIKDDNVGLCFDSGHFHCFSKDKFDITKYRNRVLAVHLHDNNGNGDMHLIPGDGTLNWEQVMTNLARCNYNGPITVELIFYTSYYPEGVDSFFEKGYEKAKELERLYKQCIEREEER